MFREMRRNTKELTREEAVEMLETQLYGTLALNSENGYPYAVPLSYVWIDGMICFHGAIAGQKFDILQKDGRASFCVVQQNAIQPAKFTTFFRSAIAYGTVRIVADEARVNRVMRAFLDKYSPGHIEAGLKYIDASRSRFCVSEMTIEHLAGKGLPKTGEERD